MKTVTLAYAALITILISFQGMSVEHNVKTTENNKLNSNPFCSYQNRMITKSETGKVQCNFECHKPDENQKINASCSGSTSGDASVCPNINLCIEQALQGKPSLDLKWVPTKANKSDSSKLEKRCEEVTDQYVICDGNKYIRDIKNFDGLKREVKNIEETIDSSKLKPATKNKSK